jgi:hypothetical protein
MGPVFVIVSHEHLEHVLKVLLVQNQHPIETVRAGRAYKPLGHAVGLRRPKRRANISIPSLENTSSTRSGEFLVPIPNLRLHQGMPSD